MKIVGDEPIQDISNCLNESFSKPNTSLTKNNKAKIQLTWKNIFIVASPKNRIWKRNSQNIEGVTIISKKILLVKI